ncbi:MAG: phosphoglucosamine mutase [Gloeomargaritaceae cyanobacterium C42_A2020_066]|nr:phosphoglucosamine mutase [Gloeomargaritaceae cyanobacterium C42_A2020_066]
MTLKAGISGLRGTSPDLSPECVVAYARAWAGLLLEQQARPAVALGRDGRRSSAMVADLVRGALLGSGCQVWDLELTLTPTVQYTLSHRSDLCGGVMVTASHNPPPWNGLKFLNAQGFFQDQAAWDRLTAGLGYPASSIGLDQVAPVTPWSNEALEAHRQGILQVLPQAAIRSARLRVALDACNSGAIHWQPLLESLGCEVIATNTEVHGYFGRPPEPLPAHLEGLAYLVRQSGCDLGLAADPDGDRLALVDEQGQPVSEEHTVVLCAQSWLRQTAGPVVVNVVTTHALDEAIDGTPVYRTAVGEMNVVQGLQTHQGVFGGEGSGGIILPAVHLARDGMVAAGLVLNLLAATGQPLSALVAALPPWVSVKAKLTPTDVVADDLRTLFQTWRTQPPQLTVSAQALILASQDGLLALELDNDQVLLRGKLPSGQPFSATTAAGRLPPVLDILAQSAPTLDLTDGLKAAGRGAWLSVRPSNTEPILRLMGEYRT